MRGVQYLHPELQPLVDKFVAECKRQGYPVLITETFRTKKEQDDFYAKGRTKAGTIVTNAKYPYSPHCWGVAFDFCRNVKGREYDNSDRFFDKVGRIAEKLFDNTEFDLFWGGDWTNFVDKPHIEMKKYMPNGSVSMLVKKYGTPEKFKATWGSVETPKQPIKKSENYHKVQAQFKLGDATMAYLANFKYSEALFEAFLTKKSLSEDTKKYVLAYKFGKDVLDRVYGG